MLRKDIDRSTVPSSPGVYKFLSKGERILYIGKAKNLKKRLQQYFSPGSVRKQDMVKKAWRIERLPTTTEQEALMLEIQLINTYTPYYNNLIRGNTAYVYIKIQKEPFPNITLTRYRKNDKAVYIGPKLRKRDLKATLQTLRQLFQRRDCTKQVFNKGVVCSDYFFGLCKGRCAYHKQSLQAESVNEKIGFTPKMSPEEAETEYDTIITILGKFFRGKHRPLQERLEVQIQQAIERQNFEWAAKLRDVYFLVEQVTEKQTVILDTPYTGIVACLQQDKINQYRCVLTLEMGRIIDVITGHEEIQDGPKEVLLAAIEREFSVNFDFIEEDEHVLAYGLGKKRIPKRHRDVLAEHMGRFIEGYISSRLQQDSRSYSLHLLEILQERYQLHTVPIHIECIDISHFSGDRTAGGLSGMYYGKLQKNMYRRFKIQTAGKHDDYGALKEVLTRRFFKHTEKNLPDLIVIDGGKGQLGIIKTLLQEDQERQKIMQLTTFVSLGKGEARTRKGKQSGSEELIYMLHKDLQITYEPMIYDDADRVLIKLRDEAHRFANAYRKKLQSKDYK